MAVIINNMDMPVNCWECDLNNGYFCDITGNSIEDFLNDEEREKDCPLKSTDEILSVIDNYKLSDDERIDMDEDSILWGMKIAYDLVYKYCKGAEQ